MKKVANHLNKSQHLQTSRFNLVVLLLFAFSMGVAGYFLIFSKAAPTPPALYLNPANQTFAPNTNFTVEIRATTGATKVNGVEATLQYPTDKLDFVSIDGSGSAFAVEATPPAGTYPAGTVGVNRGTTTPVSGDQLVAKVTFKTKTVAGAANLSFYKVSTSTQTFSLPGTSLLGSDNNNQNILPAASSAVGSTVTVDNSGPLVAITAPTAGSKLRGTTTVTATAGDSLSSVAGVQFKVNGNNIGAEDTSAPYSISWNTTTIADNLYSLTAVARDSIGNTTTSPAVGIAVDNTAPAVSITAPTNGATVTGSAVTINATASDAGGVDGVQFKLDGSNIGAEDTSAPYSINWNTTSVSAGSHTLTAVARDDAGNIATSSSINVTVTHPDTTAPNVSLTAPANGATVTGNAVAVNATASDNVGVSGVQFKLNGNNIGAEDTTSPYGISWNTTTIANGSYTLTAVARDAAGNTKTATNVTVIVNNPVIPDPDTTAPTVPGGVNSPVKTTTSITLNWNASTDPTVAGDTTSGLAGYKIYKNGTFLTSTSQLTYTDSGLTANTSYSYQVTSYDNAGNESAKTASLAVTTNANAPTVNLTASPSSVTSGSSSTLTWSTTNATSCTASGAWSGSKAVNGSQAVTPSATSTYTLTCTGPGGSANQSKTINVTGVNAPVIELSASPTTITAGESSTITWGATSAAGCTASGAWSGAKANGGTQAVTPSATSTYTLTCTGPGGSATQSVTITVDNPPPPPGKFCDFNSSGKVDIYDLSILLSRYLSKDATTDVNDDGVVNIFDLSILLSNYGK